MSDLPPGFVLDQPAAPSAGQLPPGFVMDAAAPVAAKPSIAERLWNTARDMTTAPQRFALGAAQGVAGAGIPAGKGSEQPIERSGLFGEGGQAGMGGRMVGAGLRSVAESLWEMGKAPGKMVTGEMQPGPEAESAARGMALGMAGAGGWRPGMTLPVPPAVGAGAPPGAGMARPSTVQPGEAPAMRYSLPGATERPATVQPATGPTVTTPAAPAAATVAPAAAPEVSELGSAIASNNPAKVDSYITGKYRRVVKPSRVGQQSAPQLVEQDQRILTAVDQVIANRGTLKLTDAGGQEITGALPRSLRQFSEAIDQTKKSLFQRYDAMAREAGDLGVHVDLAPVIQELRAIQIKPEVIDLHPELIPQAEQLARNFEARGFYTPSAAQDTIENLNKMLAAFYKNPTAETVSRSTVLAPVARILRSQLDEAIEGAQGAGYQALRHQYGALRSVEKDVAGAVQREANKIPGGLAGTFGDFAASEEAIRGVLTLNPAAIARAGSIKAAQQWNKHINNPNRAIERLFQHRLSSQMPAPPPGMSFPLAARGGAIGTGNLMSQRDPDQPLRSSVGQF